MTGEGTKAAELLATRDGAVLTLTLNRAGRRNALSPSLVGALHDGIVAAAADDTVGAIVLAGNGSHFSAGGDLGPGGLMDDGMLAQHQDRGRFADLLLAIVSGPVPVVAAVHGDALGGGTGLVAACHLVVMSDQARLSTPELGVGLFPWMIAPVLARKLPANVLHELILCGSKLDASQALRHGLANRVVPTDQVLAQAQQVAARCAASSQAIVAMGLSALATVQDLPLQPSLRHMHGQLTLNLMTEDAAEGISAFLARRAPTWKGR